MQIKGADEQRLGRNVTWLSIFTSTSTLICCALPALLVALGAGATLATLVGAVPQLVWVSAHKTAVFIVAGVMLAVAGWLQYRARFLPCPTDAALAKACAKQRKVSQVIYAASVVLYSIGGFFAFIAPLIM